MRKTAGIRMSLNHENTTRKYCQGFIVIIFKNHIRKQIVKHLFNNILKYGWRLIQDAEVTKPLRPCFLKCFSINCTNHKTIVLDIRLELLQIVFVPWNLLTENYRISCAQVQLVLCAAH